MAFLNCFWARFSNNTAVNVMTTQQAPREVVLFDGQCFQAVEFGNRDLDVTGVPRINIQATPRIFGLSRRTLSAIRHAVEGTLPAAAQVVPGSMVWVDAPPAPRTNLEVWDGAAWRNITVV